MGVTSGHSKAAHAIIELIALTYRCLADRTEELQMALDAIRADIEDDVPQKESIDLQKKALEMDGVPVDVQALLHQSIRKATEALAKDLDDVTVEQLTKHYLEYTHKYERHVDEAKALLSRLSERSAAA